MAFRLVGTADGQTVDLVLPRGRSVLGSDLQCDLVLAHPSVSRRHAALTDEGVAVLVEDLGSRNGTVIAARRVSKARAGEHDEVRFGQVSLRVERIPDGDLSPAIRFGAEADPDGPGTVESHSTLGFRAMDSFLKDRLPDILDLILEEAPVGRVARAVGAALHDALPLVATRISHGEAVLFSAEREANGGNDGLERYARDPVVLEVRFADRDMEASFSPIVRSAANLVALSAARDRPLQPSEERATPQLPEPETVDTTIRSIYEEATRIAAGDVGVLVCGESGTGKEVLARFVHAASPRAGGPFVVLNCAALPRELLESELFGIERGVATGVDARPGKFELADGGSLFLDEIADMSVDTQAILLRALQEKAVYRVGGTVARAADARVMAATNRNMDELLGSGRFREDLYYRIATWEVTLPPLRQRTVDIANLAAHFLEREARRRGVRVEGISEAALTVLVSARWPGNVRQLEKEMARAAIFVPDGGLLATSHLSAKLREEQAARSPLNERLEEFEKKEIIAALARSSGDVSKAAVGLGLGRSTLYRRVKALNIDPARYGGPAGEVGH